MNLTLDGKYVLDQRLGGTSAAEVFQARAIGTHDFVLPVAVKRILDDAAREEPLASMLVAESELGKRLQHRNVVSVFDVDRDPDGRPFVVMELVHGIDLRSLLDTGRLPCSLAIYVAGEILCGLAYAHELPLSSLGPPGLVHRNLSPRNVLLAWNGEVKISDFGITQARLATSVDGGLLIKGHPAYMSPEQVRGLPLDGRSDLFTVGTMLFEMLCATNPFAADTTEQTLHGVLHQAIPAVRDIRPDVAEDLSRMVASLLTRDRDRRAVSATAALAALAECADHARGSRDQLRELLSQRFPDRAPIWTSAEDLDARSQRRRRWVIAACIVAIAAAIGGVIVFGA